MVNQESEAGVNVIDDDGENFTVDFGAVKSAEALPKADYNVICEKNEFSLSKSSNKPMWGQIWTVEDGEFAGRKIYNNMSFSEAALPMTKAALSVIDNSVVLDSAFRPKAYADNGTMLGKRSRVRTKIEEYMGEKQTRIAKFMPAVGGTNAFLQS